MIRDGPNWIRKLWLVTKGQLHRKCTEDLEGIEGKQGQERTRDGRFHLGGEHSVIREFSKKYVFKYTIVM